MSKKPLNYVQAVEEILNFHKLTPRKLGLRFDHVFLKLFEDLKQSMTPLVPKDLILFVTVTAPIRLPRQTSLAIQEKFHQHQMKPSLKFSVHRNSIQINLLSNPSSIKLKFLGLVHNPTVEASELLSLTKEWLNDKKELILPKADKGNKDLKISITVKSEPKKVFKDICQVAGWWIGEVKGRADKIGSEFTYIYKTFHETTQKVVELVPNQRIVWEVTKSKINFVKNKKEWQGTKIIFDLIPKDGSTEIQFTHEGLTPAVECYGGCSDGWAFSIKKSLKNFILKGEGIDPGF